MGNGDSKDYCSRKQVSKSLCENGKRPLISANIITPTSGQPAQVWFLGQEDRDGYKHCYEK